MILPPIISMKISGKEVGTFAVKAAIPITPLSFCALFSPAEEEIDEISQEKSYPVICQRFVSSLSWVRISTLGVM